MKTLPAQSVNGPVVTGHGIALSGQSSERANYHVAPRQSPPERTVTAGHRWPISRPIELISSSLILVSFASFSPTQKRLLSQRCLWQLRRRSEVVARKKETSRLCRRNLRPVSLPTGHHHHQFQSGRATQARFSSVPEYLLYYSPARILPIYLQY